MSNDRKMWEQWKDWRLDPDTTLKKEGSLPTTVKQVNSPKLKKAKPPTNDKTEKEKEIMRKKEDYYINNFVI